MISHSLCKRFVESALFTGANQHQSVYTALPPFHILMCICGTDPFALPQRVESMSSDVKANRDEPMHYQIRLKGHLSPQWSDWFGGLSMTLEDNGETLLTGSVPDQAALHGLLKKVRDIGIPLISVVRIESD
jgi:hypothetical protein